MNERSLVQLFQPAIGLLLIVSGAQALAETRPATSNPPGSVTTGAVKRHAVGWGEGIVYGSTVVEACNAYRTRPGSGMYETGPCVDITYVPEPTTIGSETGKCSWLTGGNFAQYCAFQGVALNYLCPNDYYLSGTDSSNYVCRNSTTVHTCPESGAWTLNGTTCTRLAKPKDLGPGDCLTRPATAQPISIASGNKYLRERDYPPHSRTQLGFDRQYNSLAGATGGIGANWRVHGSIRPLSASSAEVRRYDHKLFLFRMQNGQWVGDADVPLKLTRLTDASGNTTGWQVNTEDGDVETYNADGGFGARVDRAGLGYSRTVASSSAQMLTDSLGRVFTLTYASTLVSEVTDPSGSVTRYGYDANNNLVSVTYPDGSVRQYHYENATFKNALTGISDERGIRFITYSYDASGKAVGEVMAGGVGAHGLSYGTDTTTVTDPLDASRTYTFQTILEVTKSTGSSQPGGAGCGPASSSITYDANGNVSRRTDFNGRKSTYAYDLSRNLETSRTEGLAADGTALPETRTVTTTWHPTWRLPLQVDEYAGATATGNPLRRTQTTYDDRGNVTARSVTDVGAGQTRTWTTAYTYSAALPGLILQKVEDGPRTDVTDTTVTDYYPHDEVCAGAALGTGRDKGCRGLVKRITNALGQVTQFTRYNAHGQAEELIDPNGVLITLTYDLRQRLTSRSTAGKTTSFQYDPVGQLTKLTHPDGSFIAYTYDDARRLTEVSDPLGNRIVYTLDAAGNRTKEEIKDPQGQLIKSLTRAYDALGRLQTRSGVGGN